MVTLRKWEAPSKRAPLPFAAAGHVEGGEEGYGVPLGVTLSDQTPPIAVKATANQRREIIMKHSVTKTVLATLVAGIASVTTAYGQVSCGAVITTNEVMTSNLACIFNSPAFTIDGGSVDMNGHRVGCLPGQTGIALINSGGKLKNGFVEGCDDGVILAGSGKHTVTNVMVRGGGNRGFVVLSPKNKLVRNTALGNEGVGFLVASALQPMADILIGNVAANNGDAGFHLTGDGSKLSGNLATGNGEEGFYLSGSATKFTRNTAFNNENIGFSMIGVGNSLSQNSAIQNDSWGFAPYGSEGKVKNNLSVGNNGLGFGSSNGANAYSSNMSAFNVEAGYVVFGDGTSISKCAAIGNGDDGILVGLGQENMVIKNNRIIANGALGLNLQGQETLITGNFAIDNATDDADDLDPMCMTNTWKKNIFHSTADACIE